MATKIFFLLLVSLYFILSFFFVAFLFLIKSFILVSTNKTTWGIRDRKSLELFKQREQIELKTN
jgi:hypothetical protein